MDHVIQRSSWQKRARRRRTKGLTPGQLPCILYMRPHPSRQVITRCNTSYSNLSCGAAWGLVDNPLGSQQMTVIDFCDRSFHENSLRDIQMFCVEPQGTMWGLWKSASPPCVTRGLWVWRKSVWLSIWRGCVRVWKAERYHCEGVCVAPLSYQVTSLLKSLGSFWGLP